MIPILNIKNKWWFLNAAYFLAYLTLYHLLIYYLGQFKRDVININLFVRNINDAILIAYSYHCLAIIRLDCPTLSKIK